VSVCEVPARGCENLIGNYSVRSQRACRWFPKSYRLKARCLLSIALSEDSRTHPCLICSHPLSSIFVCLILLFVFTFIVFKGRSVNRSPPPTRGFGTAACVRTRTRQRLLSAWCVMSGRGHQQGKATDLRCFLMCLAFAGPIEEVPGDRGAAPHSKVAPSLIAICGFLPVIICIVVGYLFLLTFLHVIHTQTLC